MKARSNSQYTRDFCRSLAPMKFKLLIDVVLAAVAHATPILWAVCH